MRKLTFSHTLSEDWDQGVLSHSEQSSLGTLLIEKDLKFNKLIWLV